MQTNGINLLSLGQSTASTISVGFVLLIILVSVILFIIGLCTLQSFAIAKEAAKGLKNIVLRKTSTDVPRGLANR